MKCCKADEYGGWCRGEKTVEYEDEVYCIFHAPQGAKGVTLGEFNKAIIEKLIDTNNQEGGCSFSGTIFEGDISFGPVIWNVPYIDFGGAKFEGDADFSECMFTGRVGFVKSEFKHKADFFRTRFGGRTDFFSAEFSNPDVDIDFMGAEFGERAEFGRAKFAGVTYFNSATFKETLNFPEVLFKKLVVFTGAIFSEDVYFEKETFLDGATIKSLTIKSKVILHDVNLEKVLFEDSDLRCFDFIECKWLENDLGKRILYDEDKLPEESGVTALEKVEILYRRLKQKYVDEHDWAEVSHWHYNEKRIAKSRARRQNLPLHVMYQLYDGFCGYGEMPGRAVRMFVLLIVFFSVSTAWAGLEPIGNVDDWAHNLNSFWKIFAYILNTLQNIIFQKAAYFEPTSAGGAWLKFLSQILVPIQAAFVIFTLRNRFRR